MAVTLAQKKKAMADSIKLIAEVDALMLENKIMCLPEEWQELQKFVPRQPQRQKVTMYLDKVMVKEFKKLGVNWQSHVRTLLMGYLKLVKSGILPGHDMDSL